MYKYIRFQAFLINPFDHKIRKNFKKHEIFSACIQTTLLIDEKKDFIQN